MTIPQIHIQIPPIDPLVLLRATYLGAAALVLFVFALPPLRSRFLDYGARSATPMQHTPQPQDGEEAVKKPQSNVFSALLDSAAKICVPHDWFTHFYTVSVAFSIYWAPELVLQGPAFKAIAKYMPEQPNTMTPRQVQVVWLMMLAQGGRRLYECLAFYKTSQSQMWFGHWALGILFYFCTSIAVWIEGISGIQTYEWTVKDLFMSGPNVRTFIGLLIFILSSGFQHDCHEYLASLKDSKKNERTAPRSKYRLPEHPAWNLCLTPHYLAECLIYYSLAIVAAPAGESLNWTFVCAMVFVMVNLGVTAHGTKKWYEQKFGPEAVKGKARMIPYVF